MQEKAINKIATHPLQTSYWGQFREKWGNEVLYTDYGLITIHQIPFLGQKIGMFIKCPKPTKKMLEDLIKIAKEHNLIFIKLEPNERKNEEDIKLLKSFGATPGKTLFTPSTFWIDLTKSEGELLKSFTSKTRYNIKLADKKGVRVTEDNSPDAFKAYLKLTKETVERQGFYAHTKRYHELMWETLHKAKVAHLMTATYKGEIITAWILFKWKKFLYYPYGASSQQHKNVMANNLMMWEAIRFGKKQKLTTFDLWGREEGKGFTKFKEGYSPEVVEFLGTWDLVIDKPTYYVYKALDLGRWIILRTKSRFINPKF